MPPGDENGWNEWRHHVLETLKRVENKQDTLKESVVEVRENVAKLQVKAGVWGGIAGLIGPAAVFLWWVIKGR